METLHISREGFKLILSLDLSFLWFYAIFLPFFTPPNTDPLDARGAVTNRVHLDTSFLRVKL